MDKYLSIITNFGCHYTCPYCIVRENNLKIPKTTVSGLNNLLESIKKNNCNWVSISGGGDPLHNWREHTDWYEKFFEIIPSNINIELHTSYTNIISFPYMIFDRAVYHVRNIEQLSEIKKYNDQIVRVVFVVTEDFTEAKVNKIVDFVKTSNNIDELSFRQMVDNNYQSTDYLKEFLEQGHKKDWYYIQQCDYNLYYAENKIYTEYQQFENDISN